MWSKELVQFTQGYRCWAEMLLLKSTRYNDDEEVSNKGIIEEFDLTGYLQVLSDTSKSPPLYHVRRDDMSTERTAGCDPGARVSEFNRRGMIHT